PSPPPDLSPPSLHDALPISRPGAGGPAGAVEASGASRLAAAGAGPAGGHRPPRIDHLHLAPARSAGRVHGAGLYGVVADAPFVIDRKSTRLNSSHVKISYAV